MEAVVGALVGAVVAAVVGALMGALPKRCGASSGDMYGGCWSWFVGVWWMLRRLGGRGAGRDSAELRLELCCVTCDGQPVRQRPDNHSKNSKDLGQEFQVISVGGQLLTLRESSSYQVQQGRDQDLGDGAGELN